MVRGRRSGPPGCPAPPGQKVYPRAWVIESSSSSALAKAEVAVHPSHHPADCLAQAAHLLDHRCDEEAVRPNQSRSDCLCFRSSALCPLRLRLMARLENSDSSLSRCSY